jgi:ATP-dependent Clp protease ATP-binding subunit ClpA
MALFDPEGIERFRREAAGTSLVAFPRVTLSPQWFAPGPRPATDVLFKALDNRQGCILLVEAALRYTGADRDVAGAFDNDESRGWRPLAVIAAVRAEEVLRFTDELLGLTGRPPRVPRSTPVRSREIVVGRTEAGGRAAPADDSPLHRFGVDLVEEAHAGRLAPPLYRDRETAALVRVLSKAGKNAACLIGEPGVGKTAVVEGLAVAIAEERVPAALRGARILDVNLSFLTAGASMRGDFEERVKDLVELARHDRRIVLFLDELHTVRAAGGDASQMLKADLGRGRISCIGATTSAEWRQIEADAALARRFQVIRVEELSPAQAVEAMRGRRVELERHHGVVVPDELIARAVDLAVRYLPDRRLPDKALDLLDEACACAAIAAREEVDHDDRDA